MVKSINKTTLANKYGWSYKFLVRKMNTSKDLMTELKETADYNPYQRIFTPKQIAIIYKHFGNPENEG
jgi:uncharacterized protein YktA (UPF0223 family)